MPFDCSVNWGSFLHSLITYSFSMCAPISAEADISGNLHISSNKEISLSFKKMYLLSKIKYIYFQYSEARRAVFFLVDMKYFHAGFCVLNIAAK